MPLIRSIYDFVTVSPLTCTRFSVVFALSIHPDLLNVFLCLKLTVPESSPTSILTLWSDSEPTSQPTCVTTAGPWQTNSKIQDTLIRAQGALNVDMVMGSCFTTQNCMFAPSASTSCNFYDSRFCSDCN
eukprot:g42580.t1